MSKIETIQHLRDIDPDYPACTVLLKGRIVILAAQPGAISMHRHGWILDFGQLVGDY